MERFLPPSAIALACLACLAWPGGQKKGPLFCAPQKRRPRRSASFLARHKGKRYNWRREAKMAAFATKEGSSSSSRLLLDQTSGWPFSLRTLCIMAPLHANAGGGDALFPDSSGSRPPLLRPCDTNRVTLAYLPSLCPLFLPSPGKGGNLLRGRGKKRGFIFVTTFCGWKFGGKTAFTQAGGRKKSLNIRGLMNEDLLLAIPASPASIPLLRGK